MPSPRRLTAVFALAAAALFAGSCGGGKKLSKQEYIVQADKVCADVQRKLRAVPRPSPDDGPKERLGKVEPVLEDSVERLEALEPDDALKGSADALVESRRRTLKAIQKLRKTTNRAEVRRVIQGAVAARQRTDARLKKDGFKDCASRG